MALLAFIKDGDLYTSANRLLEAAKHAAEHVDTNPYRNVIDPFSALVDAARQKISLEKWMGQEKARQTQKGFQNALGDFHQDVLGFMPGWENMGRGGNIDIRNVEKKIIAEVKNKHNTMNARSAINVYDNLAGYIDFNDKSLKAYLVEIIPKKTKPYELPFIPSERGTQRQRRDNLVKVDGRSFYALASGDKLALDKLYKVLPKVLGDIMRLDPVALSGSEDFKDLFERAYITPTTK